MPYLVDYTFLDLKKKIIVTVRNEVVKVMFLHLSVCPQGGVLPQCMLAYPPPPQQMAMLWMVCILLECILVSKMSKRKCLQY